MSSSSTTTSSSSRVSFDDDDPNQPRQPLVAPQKSSHWKELSHEESDINNGIFQTPEELKSLFRKTVQQLKRNDDNDKKNMADSNSTLALWSCIVGYCEALATHKEQRYHIFPLPIAALRRLVQDEFHAFLTSIPLMSPSQETTTGTSSPSPFVLSHHRETVKAVANAVWARAIPKPSSVRDELHANSVYVCLRGRIDKKSLDCFGAAVVTIAGLYMLGIHNSFLTLSEDHAYERHYVNEVKNDDDEAHNDNNKTVVIGTCEVAVPGNTKLAQSKRGREIADTFSSNTDSQMTPDKSWLYMAKNPVVCDDIPMALVAVMGNINCTIETRKKGGTSFSSGQLYDLKRDLLWILYDEGAMSRFPFGQMELGDCEEHRGSFRSEEWVTVPDIKEPILMNEKLYRDAIQINREVYNEAQVYPYFYAGHYHKDAGNEGPEHEYRLVEAMRLYAQAARVASKYRYESGDSMQLNKHTSSAALLIAEDILSPKGENGCKPRQWSSNQNAVAVCTWLVGFYDSLLYWEESSGSKTFVEILSPTHKFSMGKMFQFLSLDVRKAAIERIFSPSTTASSSEHATAESIPYFGTPRSKRISGRGLLLTGLQKPKVSIGEMELAIPTADDSQDGDRRASKRRRR